MTNSKNPQYEWLQNAQLTAFLPLLRRMPTMPEANRRVLSLLEDPDWSAEQVGSEIGRDVTLTGQLMKLANSAVFAPAEPISSVTDAVALIGMVRLQALLKTAWAFHLVDERKACPGFSPSSEWSHAIAVAMEADRLSECLGTSPAFQEAAFTAGILHDLGKILTAVNVPEYFMAAVDMAETSGIFFWQAEVQVLGFHHGQLGGRLLHSWGMSPLVVEAVGWHHEPCLAPDQEFSPLAVVHLANSSIRKQAPDPSCAAVLRARETRVRKGL